MKRWKTRRTIFHDCYYLTTHFYLSSFLGFYWRFLYIVIEILKANTTLVMPIEQPIASYKFMSLLYRIYTCRKISFYHL